MNQQVSQLDPLVPREQLHQILFDLVRTLFFRKIEPACEPQHVSVDDHAFCLSECNTQHNVCGFPGDARQLEQLFHCCGNLASVFFRNNPGGGFDALRFVSEEAAGMNHRFQFRGIDCGEIPRRLAPFEERGRDQVHHLVRALRR